MKFFHQIIMAKIFFEDRYLSLKMSDPCDLLAKVCEKAYELEPVLFVQGLA